MSASNGTRPTNKQMSQTDRVFLTACHLAGQLPTRSRYLRFKYGRGRAYQVALEQKLLTKPPALV